MKANRTIGIDLGTTYSCAATVIDGKPQVIKSKLGYATVPSIVTFDDRGDAVVGHLAERRMIIEPQNTIYGSKRLIGHTFLKRSIDRFQPQFRYKLISDQNGFIAAEVFHREIPLVHVSSLILREIHRSSERLLGERVERAVITVPAYFNENQRALVREAGRMADLDVIRLINEPTAAALAFGAGGKKEQRLLIFDLGGGTFDVSIVETQGFVYTVLGVGGDTFLGGIDFDRRMADLVTARLSSRLRKGIEMDAVNSERLRGEAQKAKHLLSFQHNTILQLDKLVLADGASVDVAERVNRSEFEEVTKDLCERTVSIVQEVLKTANLKPNEIDEVLLVGGQTRMPIVQSLLKDLFGFEPSKRVHPDEAVAIGAAIAADSSDKVDAPVLLDVLPMPIGIASADGGFQPVIPRNTQVPHEATVHVTVQPGRDKFKIAMFQGDGMRAADNEYLGALVLEGIGSASAPVDCTLRFELDAESILKVFATVGELDIKQEVKIATHFTPSDVLAEMNMERVQVRIPKSSVPSKAVSRSAQSAPGSMPLHDIGGSKQRSRTEPPPSQTLAPRFRMIQVGPGWFQRIIDWFKRS